jgi:hypothetical protein
MSTIKSFTDIPQSKKLAEILPIESADMFHFIHEVDTVGFGYKKDAEEFYSKTEFEYIPCWSLTALFKLLPKSARLEKGNVTELYRVILPVELETSDWYIDPVDACVVMIECLYELNFL